MHKIWTSLNIDNSSCLLAHDSVNQNITLAKNYKPKTIFVKITINLMDKAKQHVITTENPSKWLFIR